MLKIIKISLIVILIINIYEKVDNQIHNYIIDNVYINDNNYNKKNYIGYIEIEKLNIRREIVLGINDINLLNHVALSAKSNNLENNNIILAGHAIKNIFGNLKYIKYDDIIKISDFENDKYYRVENIVIVEKTNINVIDESDLILITCIDFNNRLVIKAKRIK